MLGTPQEIVDEERAYKVETDHKETICVWFSCGVASAVAAKKTIEIYGKTHNVIVVNNPIKNEHPDNIRFLKDVEKWIGQEIILAINPEPLYEEGHTFRHHEQIIAGFRIHIVDRHFIVLSRYYNTQDLVWKYVVLDQRNNAETVDETFVKRHSPSLPPEKVKIIKN